MTESTEVVFTCHPHLRQRPAANNTRWLSVRNLPTPRVRLLSPNSGAQPGHFGLSGKLSDVCRALEQWAAQDALPASARG